MDDNKKRMKLYIDVEDIMFSTQYIILRNLFEWCEKDAYMKTNAEPVKAMLASTGMTLFQIVKRRNEEFILSHDLFKNVVAYANEIGIIEDNTILLETPYSKLCSNLATLCIEMEVIFVYDNEMEQTLTEARFSVLDDFKMIPTSEFIRICSNINAGEATLYSGRTRIIDYIARENIEIAVAYPAGLMYMDARYDKYEHIVPMYGLWDHVN